MTTSDTLATQQASQWMSRLDFLFLNICVPIVVAFVTYVLVDRLGEWKERRNYSRLGLAIIDALREEIGNGIRIMSKAHEAIQNPSSTGPPTGLPPKRSWSGMPTIPDNVLLRIIATSGRCHFEGFHPRDSRIHCKNYFEHMCLNYEHALNQALILAQNRQNWREPLLGLLAENRGAYIQAAMGVDQMLEGARKLLERNSRNWRPR